MKRSTLYIDGALYASIAWFLFSQSYLSGDEAAKYIDPIVKFWINYFIGSGGAIAGALKMFRSTTFTKHVEEQAPMVAAEKQRAVAEVEHQTEIIKKAPVDQPTANP